MKNYIMSNGIFMNTESLQVFRSQDELVEAEIISAIDNMEFSGERLYLNNKPWLEITDMFETKLANLADYHIEEFLLSSVPLNESSVTTGTKNYRAISRAETLLYLQYLRHLYGPAPTGAEFKLISSDGLYEAEIVFDNKSYIAVRYAMELEGGEPEHWTAHYHSLHNKIYQQYI